MAKCSYNYRRALVTGGSGFLGRHLIEALIESGIAVRSIDLNKPRSLDKRVEFYEGDFTAIKQTEHVLEDCDVIFHLASTTLPKSSNDDIRFDISSNLLGTIGLLELAAERKVRKFVFVSSGGTVYGVPESIPVSESHPTNPTCSYGIIKLTVEKYLQMFRRLHGLETISLRLANPYGEYQRVDRAQGAIAVFCDKALRGETIEIWGDGAVVRDYVYVKDAVNAMLKSLEIDYAGNGINIGYGAGTSLDELIRYIERALGHHVARHYLPARDFDVPRIYLDISLAKTVLGWKPEVDLEHGIVRLINWLSATRNSSSGLL